MIGMVGREYYHAVFEEYGIPKWMLSEFLATH